MMNDVSLSLSQTLRLLLYFLSLGGSGKNSLQVGKLGAWYLAKVLPQNFVEENWLKIGKISPNCVYLP